MYPVIAQWGPLTLFSYGLMLGAGFLLAALLAVSRGRRLLAQAESLARRHGKRPEDVLAVQPQALVDVLTCVLIGGLVGGRLYFIAVNWEYFAHAPAEVLAIWHGGLVWYGGLLGGVLTLWWLVGRSLPRLVHAADQLAPMTALGHAVGRLGCFLNGCCYGKPTEAWCGVRFPGQSTDVFPTQLFEAGGLLLVFAWLWRAQTAETLLTRRGAIFGRYLAGYGLLRFLVEWFRGDQPAVAAGMTLAQWLSLAVVVAGWVVWSRARSRQA